MAAALLLLASLGACGKPFEQSFEVVYLTYGKPGVPYGSIVGSRYTPEKRWQTATEADLSHHAVLLFPPPYRSEDGVEYLSVSRGYQDKSSALWAVSGDGGKGGEVELSLPNRCALLWTNNPSASAAVVLYANQESTDLRQGEYGREVVALTANLCSLLVVRYAEPESLQVIGSGAYARPFWFSDAQIAYVSRSGYLIRVDLSPGTIDTLGFGVDAISLLPDEGMYAVAYRGDSISVFSMDGTRIVGGLTGASVPVLSADGTWLAYHTTDHHLRARHLESRRTQDLGLGYPVNWSPESNLLLSFERRVGKDKRPETIFRVSNPESRQQIELPDDGHIVDAVLVQ